jgi:Transcriptional regulator
MDLHKLQVFVNLSQTLNYTQTAEEMFTTQGNISKQIQALEKELNTKLFLRAHRKIALTEQGKIILPYAKNILSEYGQLTTKLNDFQTAKSLKIELHTIPTMPNYRSFSLITDFLQANPEFQLQLQEEESYNLITSLKAGQCEMIFARTFDFHDESIEQLDMETDKFVAVLPKNHPLAQEKTLDLQMLKNDRFLILGPSTNMYEQVLKLCRQENFEPEIAYEGTRVDLIMQMVQNNLGISLMMAKTVQNYDQTKYALVPLTKNIDNQLSFMRLKGQHSKANDRFWNYLQTRVND